MPMLQKSIKATGLFLRGKTVKTKVLKKTLSSFQNSEIKLKKKQNPDLILRNSVKIWGLNHCGTRKKLYFFLRYSSDFSQDFGSFLERLKREFK